VIQNQFLSVEHIVEATIATNSKSVFLIKQTMDPTVLEARFLEEGRIMMARRTGVVAKTEMSCFRAMFGTGPKICAILWTRISSTMTIPSGAGKLVHLLWSLMFLKLYCSESVLASLAGGVHEQTFRKWAWWFVDAISNLQYSVILWTNCFRNDVGNVALVSIDGTDFEIYQWQPFWTGWYSHKFKGPGLRYEVGLCILTGDIVWIHGPFPCGRWPDLKIFRSALKNALPPGEKVVANLGYRGKPAHIITPSGDGTEQEGLVYGRHETVLVNRRFKHWNILQRVFRHDVYKHQPVGLIQHKDTVALLVSLLGNYGYSN
jgi:hypothetical protein